MNKLADHSYQVDGVWESQGANVRSNKHVVSSKTEQSYFV